MGASEELRGKGRLAYRLCLCTFPCSNISEVAKFSTGSEYWETAGFPPFVLGASFIDSDGIIPTLSFPKGFSFRGPFHAVHTEAYPSSGKEEAGFGRQETILHCEKHRPSKKGE